MKTDQAPSTCPFCGAGIHAQLTSNADFINFACGSAWTSGEGCQRELQSEACAEAERERLTRERDQALMLLGFYKMDKGELKSRVKQLESDWSGWPDLQREWFGDKYATMQPWDAVRARIEDTEERVKRLEDAGDAIVDHNIGCGCGQDGPCRACRMACEAWTKAKEATP